MLRLGNIVLGKLDWSGGAFTYGNRIAIGKIVQSKENEYQMIKKIYREVYGYSSVFLPIKKRIKVFQMIIKHLTEWVEREQTLLHREPTEMEKRAGIKELSKNVGELSTIYSIARDFHCDPDKVLRWSYAKVFGILYCAVEEGKYKEKFMKLQTKNGRNR